MQKRIPLLFILFLPLIVCLLAWYCWFSPVTTIILVRHAERLNDTDTTSISEAGKVRAMELARILRSSGLMRIYVSEKARTSQTAAPTAAEFGISPIEIAANDVARNVDSVKSHGGEVILVVGHSDNVPKIMGKLGVSSPPTIGPAEFDHLFVLTVFRFRTTMVHLQF